MASSARPAWVRHIHRTLSTSRLATPSAPLPAYAAVAAIDDGNNAVCAATDQRGVARDAACDVGAYEFVP